MNPFQLFRDWYEAELKRTQVSIPSACCLSTIGVDSYPNARFVSLKEVTDESFIIMGPLNSRKGVEIERSNKVALSFWWTETEKQVRIQGDATKIATELADQYFSERNRDSKLVSLVSNQGQFIENLDLLEEKFRSLEVETSGRRLKRPNDWGGFSIKPLRIEFLAFVQTRFHDRKLFQRTDNGWTINQVQP